MAKRARKANLHQAPRVVTERRVAVPPLPPDATPGTAAWYEALARARPRGFAEEIMVLNRCGQMRSYRRHTINGRELWSTWRQSAGSLDQVREAERKATANRQRAAARRKRGK